jgi:hypothetical protein
MTKERPNFPPADPVEDLSKATPASQEPIPAVVMATVHQEALDAMEAARRALAEIHALSSSPSTNTTKLGDIAKRALDALPVT